MLFNTISYFGIIIVMAEIIFLGTAGAVASRKRDNTSLLVKCGKEKILIDCPGSPVAKLDKIGIDFRKISYIFFTHAHPDHIYGIISLLHSQYRLKNQIQIYAHSKVINIIQNLKKIFKLEDIDQFPEVIFNSISVDTSSIKPFYNSDRILVSVFKAEHKPDSIGFKFLFKKEKISCVYSGDSARSSTLIKAATNCNYLIHDCFGPFKFFKQYPELKTMHTSSLTLGKIAKEAKVSKLIPIHLAQEVEYTIEEVKQEIRNNFKGKIILPKDFYRLKLAPQPS